MMTTNCKSKKKTNFEKLKEFLAPRMKIFKGENKAEQLFATLDNCTYPVESQDLLNAINSTYYHFYGELLRFSVLRHYLRFEGFKAKTQGKRHSVFTRVGKDGDSIYIDLANERKEAIEVNTAGWSIKSDCPVRFFRGWQTALPYPSDQKISIEEGLTLLFQHIHIAERHKKIFLAWMVNCYFNHPTYSSAYPVLIIYGTSDAAAAQDCIKMLLDPDEYNNIHILQRRKFLMYAAAKTYVMSLIDVSSSKNWGKHIFNLAEGIGRCREKYTPPKTPIVLSSIDNNFVHDLYGVNRSIVVESQEERTINRWKDTETLHKLHKEFEAVLPCVFSAWLDLLVKVLQALPTIDNRGLSK